MSVLDDKSQWTKSCRIVEFIEEVDGIDALVQQLVELMVEFKKKNHKCVRIFVKPSSSL